MIVGKDHDQLLSYIIEELNNAPEYSPRDQKTKEIINANLTLTNPRAAILTSEARKISLKYIGAEILWYLEGSRSITNIDKYAKMWRLIADKDKNVNSCYGWQIFTQPIPGSAKNQWEHIINNLIKDEYSRQAVLNINQPIHKYITKDVPCTIAIQYIIRDNKLDCIVTMRSCDVIFGLGNDIPFFTFLQIKLLHRLKRNYPDLELGTYYHNCGSLHIYERHFKMMDSILLELNTFESDEWSLDNNRNVQKCLRWKNGK